LETDASSRGATPPRDLLSRAIDGLLAEFPSALAALRASVQIQPAMAMSSSTTSIARERAATLSEQPVCSFTSRKTDFLAWLG
jgi:hypothetical protein